jgi:glycosyltransferase involved in cell wall biosynthesis
LVITQALRQKLELRSKIRLPDAEIQTAPNGTDLERYVNLPAPQTARFQLQLPERFTAVYTGHFYPGRGMDVLLGLAQAFPQVQFLWVGGSDMSVAEWKIRLEENRVNNIVLTGFIPNSQLALYQAAGEVLLMPYERSIAGSSGGNSADICSPMKMFDYLAAGRVILSSDLPVIHEVLNPNNAIFCQPGDVTDWGQALRDLIDHPEKRAHLSEQARQDARLYSWKDRAQRALSGFNISPE